MPEKEGRIDVVVAANKVVETRKISPASPIHAKTVVSLADLIANKKGALETLIELQQEKTG